MQVTLLEDATTVINKKIKTYAKKGDIVTVIATHGDVLILEYKERFSMHISKTKIYENSKRP